MLTFGVDISHYQGVIDFQLLKNDPFNAKFVYMKATESNYYKDATFYRNYDEAGKAGFKRGDYHFWRGNASGALQGKYFYDFVKEEDRFGELLPCVDVEDTTMNSLTTRDKRRLYAINLYDTVKAVEDLFQKKPRLYTGAWYWNLFYPDDVSWAYTYDLWVANYKPLSGMNPLLPLGFKNWSIWQFTSHGLMQGVKGNIDQDVYQIDLDDEMGENNTSIENEIIKLQNILDQAQQQVTYIKNLL